MRNVFFLIAFTGILFACSKSDKNSNEINTDLDSIDFSKSTLDSIATLSQTTLLKNVSSAIEVGGTEYAVEFCNEKALSITDSLSSEFDFKISRISNKTRNSNNAFKSTMDELVFEDFSKDADLIDSLIQQEEKITYYKRINTAMPACIKCHGNPSTDIDELTYSKIQSLYPEDLAIGYGMNELRGLWKIEKKN